MYLFTRVKCEEIHLLLIYLVFFTMQLIMEGHGFIGVQLIGMRD